MVDKITVIPESIRAYGNVLLEDRDINEYKGYKSALFENVAIINGEPFRVFHEVYSEYSVGFNFNPGTKELYVSTDDDTVISDFSFDDANKELQFLSALFNFGYDDVLKGLYVSDVPSVEYSLELAESSYTAVGGSATVSAVLLGDGEPVVGATVTFTSDASTTTTALTDEDGVATITITFTNSTTLTASYESATATATITVQTPLFYDSGVTGTKNNNFTNTNSSKATVTTTNDYTTFVGVSGNDDKHYVPNIDLSEYSDWTAIWTYMGGEAYACQISLLNSSKLNITSSTRWHNGGSSTPNKNWYTPTGSTTIQHQIEVGDIMKLVKEGNTYSFYCNGELVSSYTTNSTVYYIGFTTVTDNRPFKYKDLCIYEGVQ